MKIVYTMALIWNTLISLLILGWTGYLLYQLPTIILCMIVIPIITVVSIIIVDGYPDYNTDSRE